MAEGDGRLGWPVTTAGLPWHGLAGQVGGLLWRACCHFEPLRLAPALWMGAWSLFFAEVRSRGVFQFSITVVQHGPGQENSCG